MVGIPSITPLLLSPVFVVVVAVAVAVGWQVAVVFVSNKNRLK